MSMIGIEEDGLVELLAQARHHGDCFAETDEVALPLGSAISTGTFRARAAPVTAFNATRSDTLKWPMAIRLRWALPSALLTVIMLDPLFPASPSLSGRTLKLTR